MPPIRVLHLISPTGYYGAEGWVIAQSRHLNPERVEIHLAATREGEDERPEILERADAHGIPTHEVELRGRFDPAAPHRVASLAKSIGAEIIHTHGYKSDVLAIMARQHSGALVISTPHGFERARGLKMRAYEQAGNWALRRCDCVAPLSQELWGQLLARRVDAKKIQFVENGVDLSEVDAELNQGGPANPNPPPRLVYVGRLARIKNVHGILEAFALLLKNMPEAEFQIIGVGDEMERLQELSIELGIDESVQFMGYRRDRLALLRDCAIFAMCSRFEGIPRSMMESMGMGLPAVAYEIPGTARLIEDGLTGHLVAMDDAEGLVQAWESILRDGDQRRAMGVRSGTRIREQFSAARVAREYEDVYEELLPRR